MVSIRELIESLRLAQDLRKNGAPQTEEVRIGKRRPKDGTFDAKLLNGNTERGIKTSNGGTITDQIVRGIKGVSGFWGLDWKNSIEKPEPVVKETEIVTPAYCFGLELCRHCKAEVLASWVSNANTNPTRNITPELINHKEKQYCLSLVIVREGANLTNGSGSVLYATFLLDAGVIIEESLSSSLVKTQDGEYIFNSTYFYDGFMKMFTACLTIHAVDENNNYTYKLTYPEGSQIIYSESDLAYHYFSESAINKVKARYEARIFK